MHDIDEIGAGSAAMPDGTGHSVGTLKVTSGQSDLTKRPHRRRTWTVQWYPPGGAPVCTPPNNSPPLCKWRQREAVCSYTINPT